MAYCFHSVVWGSVEMISFGRFEVNLESRVIRKAGMTVRLAPQPFAVLEALLLAGGAVVTREALRRQLWPDGTFLEYEPAISVSVRRLREALGDSGANPIYVETIPGVGYRWLIPLATAAQTAEAVAIAPFHTVDPAEGLERDTPEFTVRDRPVAPPMPRVHGRWKLATAVLAVIVAAVSGMIFFRNRTAGLDRTRSLSAFGQIAITRVSPNSKCLNFAGSWKTTSDLSAMKITQSGCALTGSFVSTDGAYRHSFIGESALDHAALVVERTDIRNCKTEMRVTLYLDDTRDLIYVVKGTGGDCDLSQNYRETRVWKGLGP